MIKQIKLFTDKECDDIFEYASRLDFDFTGECDRVWLRKDELSWVRKRYEQIDLGIKYRTLGFNKFQTGMSMRHHKDTMTHNVIVIITIINTDYDGGLLMIEQTPVPKEKGMTVCYPGNTLHGVTKVTQGTRITMGQLIVDPHEAHCI